MDNIIVAFLEKCPEFKPGGNRSVSEIGLRQLINSEQRCINQRGYFSLFFFFFQGVGMGEEDAFGELFSISSENREKNSVIPSAG